MKKLLFNLLISGICALSAAAEYSSVLDGLAVLPGDRYVRVPMAGGAITIIYDGVGYPLKTHTILEPQASGKTLSTTLDYIKELTDRLVIAKTINLLDQQVVAEDADKPTLDEILAKEAVRIGKQAEGKTKELEGFVAKAAGQVQNGELGRAAQKAGGQIAQAVGKVFGKKWR